MTKRLILVCTIGLLCFSGCNKEKVAAGTGTDISEAGQQVGDIMASIDESGGSTSGSISFIETQAAKKMMARLGISSSENSIVQMLLPKAQAALCSSTSFSACSSGSRTRNFNSCTIGNATFSGSVNLTFSDSGCSMASNGATVTREPDFTVTGRRGASLVVKKAGTFGQTLTKGASSFSFENGGIRRYFSLSDQTLFDFTTNTTSPITVTGATRNGRIINGGTLRIFNNNTSASCEVSPSNVTYESTCNCATSGSWAGSCSDGGSFNLSLTGCGTGSLTIGSETETINFDRCFAN